MNYAAFTCNIVFDKVIKIQKNGYKTFKICENTEFIFTFLHKMECIVICLKRTDFLPFLPLLLLSVGHTLWILFLLQL